MLKIFQLHNQYNSTGGLGSRLGDRVSDVLSSYLKMYKVTKDKAYLIKFINRTIEVINLRMDHNQINNPPDNIPLWTSNASSYQNGKILAPLAEFIHLVMIDEPFLQNEVLPAELILNFSATTYGNFALWLTNEITFSLNYIIDNYWIDDQKGFSKLPDEDVTNEINQQASLGVTLFYLGHSFPTDFNAAPYNYLHKADAMILLYNTYFDLFNNCDCVSYNEYLFVLNSSNAYTWFHSGWRVDFEDGCINACINSILSLPNQPIIENISTYIEDISHGFVTLSFRRTVYKYNFSSAIDLDDMIRWRNTFAKNIYDGFGNFHNAVDGTDNTVYPSTNDTINDLRYRALAWMPFYEFDEFDSSPLPVYDIVMNYYAFGIPGDPTTSTLNFPVQNIPDGLDFLGLAEVVAAQWVKECPDLTLYNRDVVYD
ncbi:MAG: hypothetical protein IPM77_06495 [Crocinitomicaceae bacterium]|nr:hypothetical protein [Crocinitomicaceae bacterium]